MDEQSFLSRLSGIATRWSVLRQAHDPAQDGAQRAQAALLERYQRAIYSYLLASLRDADAADEVFQQFAVKFLEGGFRGADPHRGRFRDYLKTGLIRLIIDHRRQAARRFPQLDPEWEPPAEEEEERAAFDQAWRDELLRRTWQALEDHQRQTDQPFFTVLRYRTEHPGQPSEEMAAGLNRQLLRVRPLTSTGVRKTLQRAREKFADLLLQEVAASLGRSDLEAIEAELAALELLPYCRSALARRRGGS